MAEQRYKHFDPIHTDLIASKPWYYAVENGELIVGRTITELLPNLNKKTINEAAISDLLKWEYMTGSNTLINEIKSVPPASSLEWVNGKAVIKRYWQPAQLPAVIDTKQYVKDILRLYRNAVIATLRQHEDKRIGVLLSGGLDSRLLASVIAQFRKDDMVTISYDGNPFGHLNPQIAEKIAETLDVPNIQIPFDTNTFTPENVEKAVMLADGMRSWIHGAFPIVTNKKAFDEIDMLITAHGQGEMFGETTFDSSFWLFENFIPNYHHKGVIMDRFVETVDVFAANHELLNLVACMPLELKWSRYKPISPLKLALVRMLGNGVDKIPCERTGARPVDPSFLHFLLKYPHYMLRKNNALSFTELITENKPYFDELIDSFLMRDGVGRISTGNDNNFYEIFTATASTIEIFLRRAGIT